MMDERLCGCEVTVVSVHSSSLKVSSTDGAERCLIQPSDPNSANKLQELWLCRKCQRSESSLPLSIYT